MRALVTGGAGFIGSNLAARLLDDGWTVRAVDSLTDFYPVQSKLDNLAPIISSEGAEFVEADLATADLDDLLTGIDVVFHQAGQAGVRQSWADGFRQYNAMNVDVTQRLLEAVRSHPVQRFVFASSSSVYGNAANYPTAESDRPQPHSPYGVTKLAAEMLTSAYAINFDVPVVALRYFTVYGPSQRPDMAIHRMIEAAIEQTPFTVFGNGSQVRDFTFVSDVVEANVLAAQSDLAAGTVMNIAGGGSISMVELIEVVNNAVGTPMPLIWNEAQHGDVQRTGGSIERAADLIGWRPAVTIADGVAQQVAWHRQRRNR